MVTERQLRLKVGWTRKNKIIQSSLNKDQLSVSQMYKDSPWWMTLNYLPETEVMETGCIRNTKTYMENRSRMNNWGGKKSIKKKPFPGKLAPRIWDLDSQPCTVVNGKKNNWFFAESLTE